MSPSTTLEFLLFILIPFALTFPNTLIPSAPVLLIVTEFVLFETKAPFATFTPFLPVFVIVVFPYELLILPFTTMPSLPEFVTNNSPFLLFNNPVEAIKTPDPVLSTDNLPF